MILAVVIGTILNSVNVLSEIIHHASWSVVVGIVVALSFVGLLFFLVRGCYPKATFSPLSITIGVILSLLLCVEFIPLCAAFALKGEINDFEEWINKSVIDTEMLSQALPVSTEESSRIIDKAIDEYPIFGILIASGEFTGFNTFNIAHAIANELNSHLNKLILKLLIFALAVTVLGAFLIVRTMDRKMNNRLRQRIETRPGRRERLTNPSLSRRRR